MLTAITHRKARRIRIDGQQFDISWRDAFRRSEDLLTAVFFSRLRFLSDDALMWVMATLLGENVANQLDTLDDIEFWPSLQGLPGRSHVEPDVLLHFSTATIIVEVKPPFGGWQSEPQWHAQIKAFRQECLSGERATPEAVHFLALGHNTGALGQLPSSLSDGHDQFSISIHAQEWNSVTNALPSWMEQGSRTDEAVFQDWAKAFELFGLVPVHKVDWHPLLELAKTTKLSLSSLTGTPIEALRWPSQASNLTPPPDAFHSMWRAMLDYSRAHPLES